MFRVLVACSLTASSLLAFAQSPVRPAKVGDVQVYAVQQKAERVSFDETMTITAIEGDRITTTHVRSDKPAPAEGIYGKDWGVYRSGSSGMQMSPASRVLSHPLEVGKEWEHAYEGTTATGAKLRVQMKSKVAAREMVTTPAGNFDAFRIDSQGFVNGVSFPGGWGILQKVWYAPAIDRLVRTEFKEQRTLGADNISELKSFKPAE